MAPDIEGSCENDPNFAVICAFLQNFGNQCGLPTVDFLELQGMLENTDEVHPGLVNIFLKLLRRVKKTVKTDKWERSLVAVCHNFSSQDAWEIERFGYKKAKLTSKVRVLKELLEMQFDSHIKFKNEVNKFSASELRSQPLGRDKAGHTYWFQSDENYQIRVYKEDLDDETWSLIAKDRETLVDLINKLSDGEYKSSSDSAANDDSNSLSEKPLIDTGQMDLLPKDELKNENEDSVIKINSPKESQEEIDTKNSEETDEKSKRTLRIKMPRLEKNNEKALKNDSTEHSLGETIEEPVMRIKEDGNGVENEDVNPIVGETIEENIIYFCGEGSGSDCQTGNEDKVTNEEENNTSCSSQNDSINKLGDFKNINKTDNNLSTNSNESKLDADSVNNSMEAPKKCAFFFGSASKNTTLSSTLTMGFGEAKLTEGDDSKNILEDSKEELSESKAREPEVESEEIKGIEGDRRLSSKNPVANLDIEVKQAEQQDNTKTRVGSIEPEDKSDLRDDLPTLNKKLEPEGAGNKEKPVSNDGVEKPKGAEEKPDHDDNLPSANKNLEQEGAGNKKMPVSNDDMEKPKGIVKEPDHGDDLPTVKENLEPQGAGNKEKPVANDSVKKPEVLEEKPDLRTENENLEPAEAGNKKRSGSNSNVEQPEEFVKKSEVKNVSLRSVRSKKLMNAPISQKDNSQVEKTERTNNQSFDAGDSHQEVVYVKGSRRQQKKGTAISNPKSDSTKVEDDATKLDIEHDSNTRNGKDSTASTNSSRVSSPISVADSVITFPESADSNSVEAIDKDPLADSDQDEVAPKPDSAQKKVSPKPLNLQSLSFDYNESATPPPIPVLRMLRKRGREVSPEATVGDNKGKRRKLKGKRQIDAKLRKSIEQLKEQQVSSSDEEMNKANDSKAENSISRTKKKKITPSKTDNDEKSVILIDDDNDSSSNPPRLPKPVKKADDSVRRNKNKRLLAGLDVSEIQSGSIRQSRRLAQMKIREQIEHKTPEPKAKEDKARKKKKDGKGITTEKIKKDKNIVILSSDPEQEQEDYKKKKRKFKAPNKIFDEYRPWKSSSESSEEEEVEDEEEVVEEEPPLEFKSDHEFSPESDLDSDDEYQPPKRARTARKKYGEDSPEDEKDDEELPCQKCGKADHPEMILLCDKCDNGWHCSCLRPPLLSIPEGDWFCPPCQHFKLIENLRAKLIEYDKKLSKKDLEDRRKERLAYVGISLNNVLPSREKDNQKQNKEKHTAQDGKSSSIESESSTAESESDSDEPIYQLRQRRQAKSYKFNEFDDLIKSAIQDEMNEMEDTATPCRGKDMATIVKAEVEDLKKKELAEESKKQPLPKENVDKKNESKIENDDSENEVIKPPVKPKKKARKMCNLDLSSEEDDEKDEDFKGSSSSSDEEEDDFEDDSEESDECIRGGKRKNFRQLRRSTRTRTSRFDASFIDDDDEDDIPKKKKKARYTSESDSTENDVSWRKKGIKKSKKKKKSLLDELSDLEQTTKKKKPKIKYGGLTSSEEEMRQGRRTRGKKTTYVDTLGTDSEEEYRKKNSRRIESDDDDEDFVANEDDENDSEEIPDEDDAEDENKNEEEPERRPSIAPKIYIKKPLVSKDVEKCKEKNIPKETCEMPEEQNKKSPDNQQVADKNELEVKQPANEEINVNKEKSITQAAVEKSDIVKASSKLSPETLEMLEKLKETGAIKVQPVSLAKPDTTRRSSKEPKDVDVEPKKILEHGQTLQSSVSLTDDKNSNPNEMMNKKGSSRNHLQVAALQIEQEKLAHGEDTRKQAQQIPIVKHHPTRSSRSSKSVEDASRQPMISNVGRMIRNDDSNDELSEPPMGVALPLFEELSCKATDESSRRKKGRGKGKKSLEEAVANLGGKTPIPVDPSRVGISNFEIAAPPQPFSQAVPTPSVITRMLQTKPGQTTTYPVGSIRPKQFATMPDEDDDPPSRRSRESSPSVTPHQMSSSRSPYRPVYMNHYPRGMLTAHQMQRPPSPGAHPQHYHPRNIIDPPPSGPVNLTDADPSLLPPSSKTSKIEPQNYSKPALNQFLPNSSASSITGTPPPQPPMHMLPLARTSAHSSYPPPSNTTPALSGYYENYPAEHISNEEAVPPATYENAPYPESYESEAIADPPESTESSNNKMYGEESGGEFGGLVSYFSSQREDDLES